MDKLFYSKITDDDRFYREKEIAKKLIFLARRFNYCVFQFSDKFIPDSNFLPFEAVSRACAFCYSNCYAFDYTTTR